MHAMSILNYFCPLREKPDFPDPSGPLKKAVPPTAIVAVNMKVNEALNEAELKKSASRARGTYSNLTSAQKYEVGKRAPEYGITATILHYGIKYAPGFLKLILRGLSVCMHVCQRPRLLITSGVIWSPYDWLNKFYSCYMAIVVGIVNGCGLGIDTCHGN